MKLFILAVDALEYDFVEYRSYPHLKQKQTVKVEIPRSCMTIFKDGKIGPFTPVIWRVLLTGEIEQSKPMPKPEAPRWKNPVLNWLKHRKLINDLYRFLQRNMIVEAGLPARLGFERENWKGAGSVFSDVKAEVVHNPLTIDVKWAHLGINTGADFPEIARSMVSVFEEEKRETFRRISSEWELFLTYTKLLDITGHLFWQRDKIMEKYYGMIDDFAGEIQENLDDDICLLILSDHGMRPLEGTRYQGGEHSHHAFLSSDKQLRSEPQTILDIYPLIREVLQR